MSRLERQISRINKTTPARQLAVKSETDHSLAADKAHVDEATLVPIRHDPKFSSGNFWRERKEKKKRTLFVGNLPARSFYKTSNVIELVRSIVEASEESAKLDCATLVEHVEFLGQKKGAMVHHAYVTFASLPAATLAQQLLDGLPVERQTLRANFSADKQMRSIAISKRNGFK
jgi:hypothetical protein